MFMFDVGVIKAECGGGVETCGGSDDRMGKLLLRVNREKRRQS